MSALADCTLKISASIASDCLSFVFSDDTGVFNNPNNLGGYGGGVNIPSSGVQTAKVRIYEYGATVPTLLTFTVVTNVITAATLTKPDGTTTSILADLVNNVFPFSNSTTNPLTITNVYLGFADTDKISDQVWTFSYEIIGAYTNLGTPYTFNIITSIDELVTCNTACCVKKMAANLKPNCCECGDSLMQYMKAKAMLESAEACADIGQYDAAQNAIVKAKELCDDQCSSC